MLARRLIAWLLLGFFAGLYGVPVASALAPDERCPCGCGKTKRTCACHRKTSAPGVPALFAADCCAGTCGYSAGVRVTSHIAGALPPARGVERCRIASPVLPRGADPRWPGVLTAPSLWQRPPPAACVR